jgi:uncharacterized phage-associated protein
MTFDPRSLANYILDATDQMAIGVTNMALNKILYFSHGWYLALESCPLTSGAFEAWEHGPVLPVICHQFKNYKDQPIRSRATQIDLDTGADVAILYEFPEAVLNHLDRMINFYAPKSGPLLSFMSHEQGAPWDTVRSRPNQSEMVICNEMIETFFATKLRSRKTGPNGQA